MSQCNTQTYIGADLHKNTCYLTIMDKDGDIKKRTEISTDTDEVSRFFTPYKDAHIAVESTMNWMPFYETVESLGLHVNLSNPLQTKAIASARIKNDKVDSKILADLLRTNLLPLSYVQPREIRDLKELVRQRMSYVEIRTRIKNKIHSVLFKNNLKHDFTCLYGKAGMIWLKELKLRDIYRQEMDRYLTTLDLLDKQVEKMSATIMETAKTDYDCQLLMTIPGIKIG